MARCHVGLDLHQQPVDVKVEFPTRFFRRHIARYRGCCDESTADCMRYPVACVRHRPVIEKIFPIGRNDLLLDERAAYLGPLDFSKMVVKQVVPKSNVDSEQTRRIIGVLTVGGKPRWLPTTPSRD